MNGHVRKRGREGDKSSEAPAQTKSAPVGSLVNRYEADEYLTINPYIINYFRNRYSVSKSFVSVCELHNETGNIWTHFLPFLALFFLGYQTWIEHPLLFPVGVPAFDKWMLVGTIAFCASCFFNSTVYHTFMSHSERAYGYLLRLDYCGINGVIVACTVGGVYFGFYCFPEWKILYMTVPTILGGSVMILDLYPLLIGGQSVRQMHAVHKIRVFLFTFMVCFGLCPLFHWVYLNGYYSVASQNFLWRILMIYVYLAIGFFFYLTRIPERFAPGKFDLLLHSHQLWHVFVAAGPLWLVYTSFKFVEFAHHHPC
eukprot:TRINITY_DN8786_c0_g1_i1.p1 TRINITY_DN8786_c0_g1~~TRINITY_DN8786_c0_g1_i1.p1  ORF type:complete len:312 (-),score=10.17 TRINITY_DN8786_c0_g1_i1:142-1077(-)